MSDQVPATTATPSLTNGFVTTTGPAPVNYGDAVTAAPPAEPEQKPTETVDFWKAKAREQETRAKSNAEAAKRLADIEEAQKTDQQKQADATAKAQRELAELQAQGLRYQAAIRHKLTEEDFDLLGSGTEEELNARAERISKLRADAAELAAAKAELEALKQGKPVPSTGRPVESLKPGATPGIPAEPESEYPSHWAPRARA